MGAGKSLIAKTLSDLTDRQTVSTDDLIVEREEMSINEIFDDKGEQYFRALEKQIVAEVAGRKDVIIDCGGGVVLDPANIESLKTSGRVFYLSASPQEIFDRIKHEEHRPLLKTPDPAVRIRNLLDKRRAFYEKADQTVETDARTPLSIAQEILDAMSGEDEKV